MGRIAEDSLDGHCAQFEHQWQQGVPPDLRAILHARGWLAEEENQALAVELVCIDLEFRWRLAEQIQDLTEASGCPLPSKPSADDYRHWLYGDSQRSTPDEWLAIEYRMRRATVDDAGAAELKRLHHCRHDLLEALKQVDRDLETAGVEAETIYQSSPVALSVSQDPPLAKFGDYELLDEIARGGMGVVYRARQSSLNRPVALKMILAGQFASVHDVRRFQTEAEAAAGLDHLGIVPIYEIGEHDGHHFFSMKLIDGASLAQRKADYLGDQRKAAELMIKIAHAIRHAHQRGVLHRDLKPGNILIDEAGEPHVTDFGLARQVDSQSDLTRTGAILGTPSYMPPEQATGSGQITTAADIYSLGAILYELLTGQAPFRSDNPIDTVLRVINDPLTPPRELDPHIDRGLELICQKCLEKDPEARFGSAEDLAKDLEHWLADEPLSVRPQSMASMLRFWMRQNFGGAIWILVIGLAAGLGAGFLVWLGGPQENIPTYAELYDQLPSVERPLLLRLDWRLPIWLRLALLAVPVIVFSLFGFLTAVFAQPKNRQADIIAGIAVSLIAGLGLFVSCMGPLAVTSAISSNEQWLLRNAARDTEWAHNAIISQFPDLADESVEDRLNLLANKISADQTAKIPFGIVGGMVTSLLLTLAIGVVGVLTAGPLVRNSPTLVNAAFRFSVICMPWTALVFLAGTYTIVGPMVMGIRYVVLEPIPFAMMAVCLIAAMASATLRWSLPVTLASQAIWIWCFAGFIRTEIPHLNNVGRLSDKIHAAERLAAKQPDVVEPQLALSWDQSDLGYYYLISERYRLSAKWYRRAIDTRIPVMDRIQDEGTRTRSWLDIEQWHHRLALCYGGLGHHEQALETIKWFKPSTPENWRAHGEVPRAHIESMIADGTLETAEAADYLRDYVTFQVRRQNGDQLADEQFARRVDQLTGWLGEKLPWRLIGPFEGGKEYKGFDTQYPPEADLGASESYASENGTLSWKDASFYSGAYVDLRSEIADREFVVCFAKTSFERSDEQTAVLSVGCDDGCKVWLNGELVMQQRRIGGHRAGEFTETVQIREGQNTLLVKITQHSQPWSFSLDLLDEEGWPLDVDW